MDVDAMNTVLFTNLQLLGMDIIAMEGKYHIPFSKDMFNLPNKAGSEAVFHFLFDRLNPTLFKEQFRDCWPVLDRKAEMQFRKVCNTWLSSIQADNPDAHLPKINASLLLSPGGRKFIHLLYKFSSYILTQTMTKEHRFNIQDALTYPVLNRSSFGDIMSAALEDSCLQLHSSCFEQLHLTVAANRKWRENADEMVKIYRRLSRAKRDYENEKRQLVSTLAENAQKQDLSLPVKRTVSMFDSGQDMFSKHRGKRMEEARSKWSEVHKFSEDMRDKRKILKSVLDTISEKPAINGNDLGVRIPNLLLQEFQKEIQKQEIDNVYKGGCLNLESVSLLWNMCLRRYREEMDRDVLPELSDEIPEVKTQVEQHYANLKIAQKTKDEVLTVTIPKIQSEVEGLNGKLQSRVFFSEQHDKSNNSPSLGLIAPTPPLTTSSRNVKTNDTPTFPVLTSDLKNDTPDAVSSVVGKVNQSIRLNSDNAKGGLKSFPSTSQLKALKKSTKASFPKSDVPDRNTTKAAHLVKKHETGFKESKRPPHTGKSLEQKKKKTNKNVLPTVPINTSATIKESSEDVLVNSIVESVLDGEMNHRDSWSLELKSINDLIQLGNATDHGSTAFVPDDMVHHSLLRSSPFSPYKHDGSNDQSNANFTNNKYQEDQDPESLDNTSLWKQASPTDSEDKKISDQPTDLFSPITSLSADSQLDSVASASNRNGHAQSPSVMFSPVSSHLSPARGSDVTPLIVLDASDALVDQNNPNITDDSESKHLGMEITGTFSKEEDNTEMKDSFYKSLIRFPGDGQPSQEPEASSSSDNSDSEKDHDFEMRSMSKDSLFDPTISSEHGVSPPQNLIDDSSKYRELAKPAEVKETVSEIDNENFQEAQAESGSVSRPFLANLHNLSSEDVLDLDLESADDILQSLSESFSPAKGGIVFESGRLSRNTISPAKATSHSLVSGTFSSESFDRTPLSTSPGPENTLRSADTSSSTKMSSDCKQTSSCDIVPKSQDEDFFAEMVLLQKHFASMVFKSGDK